MPCPFLVLSIMGRKWGLSKGFMNVVSVPTVNRMVTSCVQL